MIANIEKFRKEKRLNQDEVAKYLGITRQTYSKIEKGTVEINLGQAVKLAELLGVEIDNFIKSDFKAISNKSVDLGKYKQIIQFFIDHGTTKRFKITKTKLAKLCYLADFAWYYNNLEPITGLEYKKLPQGPVPDEFFRIVDELENEQAISLILDGQAHLYSNISYPKTDKLSLEEKSLLMKIAEKWKKNTYQEIVEFTHKQLPWMICNDGEIIPYGLITQEDPDNVY